MLKSKKIKKFLKHMENIRIVTDSSSDIPGDIAKEMGIEVVPLYVGYDGDFYKDNIEIKHKDVFEAQLAGKKVNTASPSPGDFANTFENILKKEKTARIFCITLSSKLSGSFNAASTAKKMLSSDDIEIIDSRTSTLSLGLIAMQAAESARLGVSYEEVRHLIYKLIDMNKFIAVLGSFEYVFKGGRGAFFGKILSKAILFTPILTIGRGGKVHLKKFCRSKKSAMRIMSDQALSISRQYGKINIGVFYGMDPLPVEAMKKEITSSEDIIVKRLVENKITTVISAHTGPELWGIAISPYLLK